MIPCPPLSRAAGHPLAHPCLSIAWVVPKQHAVAKESRYMERYQERLAFHKHSVSLVTCLPATPYLLAPCL